jgi:ketosteroid isomerase-like protein
MASAQVEMFRRGLQAWNEGSFDRFAQTHWHPEITLVDIPEMPDGGRHVGREAALRRFAEFTEPLGRFNLELEEAIEGPDMLVVTAVLTGESTGGSVPLAGRFHYVARMRDGQLAELRLFQQRADALAAAGLD